MLDLSLLPSHEQEPYLRAVAEQLVRQRADTGLPHWVVCEEAHILLAHEEPARGLIAANTMGLCAVTYRPHELNGALRDAADAVVAAAGAGLGTDDAAAFLAGMTGRPPGELSEWMAGGASEEAVLARTGHPELTGFRVAARRTGHVRHQRKYAAHLGFFFRISGLDELRAVLECCPGTTVDFHARRHDFSRWIGEVVGDGALAAGVAGIETQRAAEPATPEATRHALLAVMRTAPQPRHHRTDGDDTDGDDTDGDDTDGDDTPDHLGFFLHVSGLDELRAVLECCPGTTLDFHARRHDFSRWIGEVVGDGALAAGVVGIEAQRAAGSATLGATRASLLNAIDARDNATSTDGTSS